MPHHVGAVANIKNELGKPVDEAFRNPVAQVIHIGIVSRVLEGEEDAAYGINQHAETDNHLEIMKPSLQSAHSA